MTNSAAWAFQRAALSALKASEALRALLGGDHIYDAVPTRPLYPYVTIGPHTLREFSTGDSAGKEHTFTVTAFSRAQGFREVNAIAEAIASALMPQSLSLSGHKLVLLRPDTTEIRRAADALTSRATVIFRAISEPLN